MFQNDNKLFAIQPEVVVANKLAEKGICDRFVNVIIIRKTWQDRETTWAQGTARTDVDSESLSGDRSFLGQWPPQT